MDDEVEISVRIVDGTAVGAAQVRARARKHGQDAGKEYSKGVGEGVKSGPGRDEFGRFTRSQEGPAGDSGERSGKSWSSRFAGALRSDKSKAGASGILSGLKDTLMAGLSPTAKTLATAFSAQFVAQVAAGIASGAVKMVQGLGAVLALLPAIAVAAGVALGVVKIALSGVGDALKAGLAGDTKKFEEALKGLAPEARTFARGLVSLKDELRSVKHEVQGRFFAGFADQIRPLGEKYLPMVQGRLGGIASSFGRVGGHLAKWLQTPKVMVQLAGVLDNVGLSVDNVAGGVMGLVRAFLPLVTVGSTFLPGLTHGFGGLTEQLARFMENAAKTGELHRFISRGLSAIGDLADTGQRLWRIFQNIYAIGKIAFSNIGAPAGGLLKTIEKLTAKARAFFETAEGGRVMAQIMGAIRSFAESSMGTLQKLAGIIAPFLPQIADFLTAFNNLKTAILDAIEPAIQIILGGLLPALTKVLEWVTNNKPVLQAILISLFTLWALNAGIAAAATLAATWPLIALGVAIAALAYLVIVHFDTIKRWISNVFNWVLDNWWKLLGVLIAPIAGAVWVIVAHWDTIWAAIVKVAGLIGDLASTMWEPIADGLATVVDRVTRLLNQIPGVSIGADGNSKGSGYVSPKAQAGGSARKGGATSRRQAHGGVGGGLTRLAELGREMVQTPDGGGVLVDVPHGSRVHPNSATNRMLGDSSGGGQIRMVVADASGASAFETALIEIIRRYVIFTTGGDAGRALGYART